MRSYNDIIHIEIIYKSKDNQEELSKDTIGTAVSGPFALFIIVAYHNSTHAQTMAVSFGEFKLNEISELIGNKDPLGLNTDIESYSTIKNKSKSENNKSEVPLNTPDANQTTGESKMEYDVIPHLQLLIVQGQKGSGNCIWYTGQQGDFTNDVLTSIPTM